MADQVMINVTRDELYAIFKNHRLVRAFENLLNAVTSLLPEENLETRSVATGAALGVFGPRASVPPSIRATDGLTLVTDAAGPIIGLDIANALLANRAFSGNRFVPKPERDNSDGDVILASRVFNRR